MRRYLLQRTPAGNAAALVPENLLALLPSGSSSTAIPDAIPMITPRAHVSDVDESMRSSPITPAAAEAMSDGVAMSVDGTPGASPAAMSVDGVEPIAPKELPAVVDFPQCEIENSN